MTSRISVYGVIRIVEDVGKRVGENRHGFLERYSVFDPVRERLVSVPFKPQVHPPASTLSHIPFLCPLETGVECLLYHDFAKPSLLRISATFCPSTKTSAIMRS